MKLTFVLCLATLLQVNASSNAQNISIKVKDATLLSVFKKVHRQTGLEFIYDNEVLKGARLVSLNNVNTPLSIVLDQCFQGQPFSYQIIQNMVVIKKTEQTTGPRHAINFKVTGNVTEQNGTFLAGVNIKVRGLKIETTSDANGNFTLDLPDAGGILVFSFVGFLTQEIPVKNAQQLKVVLRPYPVDLMEVAVVSIGYGTQRRSEVTSAITTIKPKDFNQGGVRSPVDLIRGKVPGLTITRPGGNNNPNSESFIQLRGTTTLSTASGANQPLIIIDDIPGGDLSLVQQDEIASFDVLKDGSAAAIYGTRANAGVIIITTKKGKAGEPRYEYASYFATDRVSKRPDVLSADEFRALATNPSFPARGTDGGSAVDYYDLLLNKNNLTQYHNFAASGGAAKTNYRASLFYSNQSGIARFNDNKQYGGRININQKGLNDRLYMQMNFATRYRKSDNIGGSGADFEQAIQQNPTTAVTNDAGLYNDTPNDAYYYNPIARINQEEETGTRQNFSGDVKFTLDLFKGLKASAFGSVGRVNYLEEGYQEKASRSSIRNNQGGGNGYKSNSLAITRTFESTVDYSKVFGNSHAISTILGYSYQDISNTVFNASNSGYLSDAFKDNNLADGVDLTGGKAKMGSSRSASTLIAFFGRLNYALNNKYLASVIYRHEGSSKFGANHKWGNFPAVSAGWNISEENFMQNITAINNLKFRIGYGITGNQNIGDYQSLTTLGTGGTYLNNGVWYQTYGPNRNPNPDLRWERKKELNIGTDFRLFDNRLGGSVDLYKRRTEDLLASYAAQVPPFVLPTIYTNVGSIENKGIELALNIIPISKKDFKWEIDFTANTQRNKLTAISNDVFKGTALFYGTLTAPGSLGNTIRTVEGGPLGSFYGKRFAGFTDKGEWLFYKADGTKATISDVNNNDMAVIGNGVPKYMSSLNNRFTYKNLDLSFFLRGKFDFDILNLPDLYYANPTVPNNLLASALGKHSQIRQSIQYSDYYIEKGDFVKLDNITIGYNLNTKTSYLRNLRVYASCQNVATFTKYTGLDPEVQDTGLTTGIDNRTFYPYTRTFTLGLNVGF